MQSLKVKQDQSQTNQKTGAFKVTITTRDDNSSENESASLIVQHGLSVESVTKTNGFLILVPRAICATSKTYLPTSTLCRPF